MATKAPMSLEITGAKELRKLVRDAGKDAQKELKEANKSAAGIIADKAKTTVPVRSGRLKRSIKPLGSQSKAQVKAGLKSVPYAGPIHFGWSTRPNKSKKWRGGPIRPNPFIYEAMSSEWKSVMAAYEKQIEKLVKNIGT